MFDLGWSELLLVAVLAIVFIGPKDLPRVMRTLGQYVGKMKSMAREFQNSFEDLARESELEELRKQVADLHSATMKPLTEPMTEMKRALDNVGTEGRGKAAEDEADPTPALPTAEPDAKKDTGSA
ncbi:MAG: Sec-independent protein translocase protein TatB [Parvibaculum sp.]|nr:Sec-independent protein translocase protein TatB [Parvibaculum sp.]